MNLAAPFKIPRNWLKTSLISLFCFSFGDALQANTLKPFDARLNVLAQAPNWSQLEQYAHCLTQEEFEIALRDTYQPQQAWTPPWSSSAQNLSLAVGEDQVMVIPFANDNAERKKPQRFWQRADEMPKRQPDQKLLDGVHIAIDPGHIGGDYAQMEERWISIDQGKTAVIEGNLTLQTAQILKHRLEELGAKVSLVRDSLQPVTQQRIENFYELAKNILIEAGITDPPLHYQGREDLKRVISVQWQAEKLFYRVSEIRARAERINQHIQPDMVLCLHFNAEEWGDPQQPTLVEKNHLHLLINGCYSADEIRYQDTRFELLQRVYTGTHQVENELGKAFCDALAQSTQLPPYQYQTPNARQIDQHPYLYARNLLANRLYQCPVFFFEPYIMNHRQTYQRLIMGHYLGHSRLEDQMVSSAIEDYVQGIVDGLRRHYLTHRK